MDFSLGKRLLGVLALTLAVGALVACGGDAPAEDDVDGGTVGGKADSSIDAVVLNFRFKSEFIVDTSGSRMVERQIEEQLFYTVGQLNGDRSVSRLDQIEILSVERKYENGRVHVFYEARIPVAWGKLRAIPKKYVFVLPKDMSYKGQVAFTEKYKKDCVEEGAHDVDVDSMFYDFRPQNCSLADADVVRTSVSVTKSRVNTTGKYPEYDKIWEDGELRVVAIYGKNEKDAQTARDEGIATYNGFVRNILAVYEDEIVSVTPKKLPDSLGVSAPDVEFTAVFADGRRLTVAALLVSEVSSATQRFFDRYTVLSKNADLIIYSGHSGLGANIQTLASYGDWQPGQYAIVYMNGCDSYAYVDAALWDAHAAVNEDDPEGTKYLDIMMNALPSPFGIEVDPTPHLITALLNKDRPKSYQDMFRTLLREPIVIVSGEQDNAYRP